MKKQVQLLVAVLLCFLFSVDCHAQNDHDAAEGIFIKALEADPGYTAARNNLKRLRRQALAGEKQ